MAVSDRTAIRLHRVHDPAQRGPFRFRDFEFDAARVELRRGASVVPASTLSLTLLDYLLAHRERVVSRDELVEGVWRGVIVTEGSLRQAIWELRQTLEDSGDEQQIIRTVRGRGYRFVAALNEPSEERAAEAPWAAPSREKTWFGRAGELEQLHSCLLGAQAESGRACAIVGAPGVGKTHLMGELARSTAREGVGWFEAAADPDGAAPAFWPWLSLLRDRLQALPPTRRSALLQRFPVAERLLTARPELALESARTFDDSPAHEQFAMLSELSGLLVATLDQTPSVLLIEDLQWADQGSLALLRHLLPLLPRTRALLVVTCRAQKPRDNRPLARTLEAINRSATGAQLTLSGLNREEVAELLALHVSAEVPADVATQIFELSSGNPLFASELALLLARDSNREPSDEVSLASDERQHLDFASVIQRRLHALPESALNTALAASVLGPEFSLAEIAALLELSPQAALLGIDLCIDHGLLLDRQEPRFRFVHPLVREAAYASVSRSERCHLHRLAGEWLERSSVDARGTRLNELAHHFFHAAPSGSSDKAVRYGLRCAQLAYAATAYKDAIAQYDRAIACMDLDPRFGAVEKLEAALMRGEALRASAADTERVNQHFLALAEQAELLGEHTLFARAVLGYTGQRTVRFTPTRFAVSSNLQEVALIERALTAVGNAPSELRALLLCSLMGSLMYSTERARRESAAAEATAIAHSLQQPFIMVRVLTVKVYCCAAPERAAERLETCNELLAIAAQHGLRAQEADGLITRALCHLSRGDTLRASQDEERARSIAQTLSMPQVRTRSELLDLMRAIWQGEIKTAKRLSERALAVAPEDLAEQAIYMMRMSSFQLLESGSLEDSIVSFENMLRTFPEAIGVRCGLASNYATQGNREEALRHFDLAAQNDFNGLPEDLGWLGEMCMLAEAATYLDDRARAELVYLRLAPYGQIFDFLFGEIGPIGSIAHWLAGLSLAMRDFPLAHHWLSVASDLNQRLGASFNREFGRLLEARVLLMEDAANAGRARMLIDGVKAFFEKCDVAWLGKCIEREERLLLEKTHAVRAKLP